VANETVRELCGMSFHCNYGRLVFVMPLPHAGPPRSKLLISCRNFDSRSGFLGCFAEEPEIVPKVSK